MSTAVFACADVDFNREFCLDMTTIATLEERIGNHIKFFWGISAVFAIWLAGISVVLFYINGKLGNLNSNIGLLRLPQQLEQSSITPQDPKSQDQAVSILRRAKTTETVLPEPVIQNSGMRFIEAADTDPNAWNVALDLLNYRSFLNASLVPPYPDAKPAPFSFSLAIKTPPAGVNGSIIFLESNISVPLSEAAKIEPTDGRPYVKAPGNVGPAYLIVVVKAFEIGLDNMLLKNVIIRNATIDYNGGPLILYNVAFVNCTFKIPRNEPSKRLASSLLASTSVNFDAPKS